MPSLEKLKSIAGKSTPPEKSLNNVTTDGTHEDLAPPSYTVVNDAPSYLPTDPVSEGELNSAFQTLTISSTPPPFPDTDHCLAHLKLLSALNALKEDVGYTEGLFGIQDPSEKQTQDNKAEALAAFREKRWNLYVARAVERFQEWWLKVLCMREKGERMTCGDSGVVSVQFIDFPKLAKAQMWTTSMLPPLDVLMVWHTFMLNPRNYLEDCAKLGLKDLWATGMPWSAVNEAIDTGFNYNISEEVKAAFTDSTGYHWDNTEDSLTKVLSCPRCNHINQIPWTTCGDGVIDFKKMNGSGYGDRDFIHSCTGCGKNINHDLLRVNKFKKDTENLMLHGWPMGGTILARHGGLATDIKQSGFVNRLIQKALRIDVLEILEKHAAPTMESIKGLIERSILSKSVLRKVNESAPVRARSSLELYERAAVRTMMSRYWDNSSVFSLELGGAVIRQSLFVGKMQSLDWLHSPAARDTMKRLLVKYGRFINLMAANPERTAVPTLDVDLGWHTHQLSPQQYYNYTMQKSNKFIDHDDKISEDQISHHFEWTSSVYQKTYKEVYSECTCWYCEAIRARHTETKLFGNSKQEKPVDDFYRSGAAELCPPDKSAHISTHNVVRVTETLARKVVFDRLRFSQQSLLQAAYLKACQKADKNGRKRPDKNDFYYHHWGYPMMVAPFVAAPLMVGAYYYAGDAGSMPQGVGVAGSCVAGTCGGGAAAGTCAAGAGGGCGGCGGGGGGCGGGS